MKFNLILEHVIKPVYNGKQNQLNNKTCPQSQKVSWFESSNQLTAKFKKAAQQNKFHASKYTIHAFI